ncbi:hypothetical protein STEG23_036584, partial [Scotinomys teguina]
MDLCPSLSLCGGGDGHTQQRRRRLLIVTEIIPGCGIAAPLWIVTAVDWSNCDFTGGSSRLLRLQPGENSASAGTGRVTAAKGVVLACRSTSVEIRGQLEDSILSFQHIAVGGQAQ